jgi:3-oxoacyl-[acyl-carrier protein] reductase
MQPSQLSLSSSILTHSVAVVTGGSRGIGFAVARKLSSMGASVIITGRDQAQLQQAAQELTDDHCRVEGLRCDVCSLPDTAALAAYLRQRYAHVDILVNNAGIGGPAGALHELQPQDWDAIFNTNLRGVYYMVRQVAPMMIAAGSGHIINISSLAGKNPLPRGAAYSASKWGLNGLTYSIAEELRTHNIRVSLICPGSVETRFSPHSGKDPKKMLQPGDIAHAVAMLVRQQPQSFISEISMRPTQKP